MYDCQHLDHPFLHDPGVSQTDRALKALLPENLMIDGRKTSDLLNYFSELAPQINFYNPDLSIADWTPFFNNSLPFLLSQVAAYPLDVQQEKLNSYARMLERNATPSGLQLLLFYSYYNTILPLNRWALLVQGTGLDLETQLNQLIKANLQQPLLSFISLANTASHCYGTRKIDFSAFLPVTAWGLDQADLYAYQGSFLCSAGGTRTQLLSLWEQMNAILPFFTGVITQVSSGAANDVNNNLQTLLTLDGKQDLSPHLALLFSFVSLFGQLQTDLNHFAKRHLNYFYTKVLRLKTAPAVPDNAFLVFSIQQQYTQYALDKGILVKDGKDNNKADILFGLTDQIVVNQAKITDTRTLFFNNLTHYDQYYTEGAYMAPNALMADGLTQAFADPSTASWPTLGAQLSKYTPTGDTSPIPYPSARLGFILHSPVLLLNEGKRTITITLACEYNSEICPSDPFLNQELGMMDLVTDLNNILDETYFYFTQDSLAAALANGLDPSLGKKITHHYLTEHVPDCYGKHPVSVYDVTVESSKFSADEIKKLKLFFALRSVFQLQFSGAKGWVIPDNPPKIELSQTGSSTEFVLKFHAVLHTDLPAVTFYDKKVFGVDYQTTEPLVMVLLDDTIKIRFKSSAGPDCCLEQVAKKKHLAVSTYQFFKYLTVKSAASTGDQTSIVTDVCGLKNFVVQNDQNVMDVNSPVYPFGTRPTIIDFDKVQPTPPPLSPPPPYPNLTGPNFYIGSEEIFYKAWTSIWIGMNWQNKPTSFNEYYAGYLFTSPVKYGLDEKHFWVNLALLTNGVWQKDGAGVAIHHLRLPSGAHDKDRPLFATEADATPCKEEVDYAYSFFLQPKDFGIATPAFSPYPASLTRYNADTRQGFLRFRLDHQDFLAKDYSFVLARQMLAFGKLPDNTVDGAVYYAGSTYYVLDSTAIVAELTTLKALADSIQADASNIGTDLSSTGSAASIVAAVKNDVDNTTLGTGLVPDINALESALSTGLGLLTTPGAPGAVIPKEPWTPIIQNMEIHYSATASITDMHLIQLYPFDGTFQAVDINAQPSLLPVFCAEGLLFLGVQHLMPGENLNILFQLAEATADSEDSPDAIIWEYLTNNQWETLAPVSQVIKDGTASLTRSGIIQLAIPNDISSTNTVMPSGLSWLRASVPSHVPGVSETIAMYTQAVEASFVPSQPNAATGTAGSDLTRLAAPLAAGSLSKLNTANAAITGIQQPSPSFGGQAPESSGNPFFIRISELLRHKGRGIQKWDYERLVLQNYPQVWAAKCINHSYFLNAHQYRFDFPMAPGNVILAVIPDTSQLTPADSLQPRVPESILEAIHDWLCGIISPFIQLFVVNPRYEPIDFCLEFVLVKGMDRDYYQQQVKNDLTQFLAPWQTGAMDRFEFGQPLYRSDVLRFLESLAYIDYLLDLEMTHQGDNFDTTDPPESLEPLTPRSILIAGDIAVKIPKKPPAPCSAVLPDCSSKPEPVVDHCKKK